MDALNYLHNLGVVHLDLKPANFVVMNYTKEEIEVKIIDFGLARRLENGVAFIEVECGSKNYKAPEVKDASYVTATADIYSFGIFLYQLCVGYFPSQVGQKEIKFRPRDWRKYART